MHTLWVAAAEGLEGTGAGPKEGGESKVGEAKGEGPKVGDGKGEEAKSAIAKLQTQAGQHGAAADRGSEADRLRGGKEGGGKGEEGGRDKGGLDRRKGGTTSSNRGGPLRADSRHICSLVKDANTGVMVQVLGGGEREGGGGGEGGGALMADGTLMDGFVGPQVCVCLCLCRFVFCVCRCVCMKMGLYDGFV